MSYPAFAHEHAKAREQRLFAAASRHSEIFNVASFDVKKLGISPEFFNVMCDAEADLKAALAAYEGRAL